MQNKKILRKKYFQIRKKKYFEIKHNFFNPIVKIIYKKRYKKDKINLSSYYPASHEVNVLKIFDSEIIKKFRIFLPVIQKNNSMYFYKWTKNETLKINKFGMLEPIMSSTHVVPDIMLVPCLAFDKNNNRLGYGGGFYDRYLNKFLKKNKDIVTIGVAFSFQKHHKLPLSNNDVKLDYILTEKGINFKK